MDGTEDTSGILWTIYTKHIIIVETWPFLENSWPYTVIYLNEYWKRTSAKDFMHNSWPFPHNWWVFLECSIEGL